MTKSSFSSGRQSQFIQMVKCRPPKTAATNTALISIRNENGSEIGLLDPITRHVAKDTEIIARLTRWRQAQMRFFLTQFEASSDRTQAWLNNTVLNDDRRLLWLIRTPDGEAIGSYGICNLQLESVELDNLIRGEQGGDPRLIYYAELALLMWLIQSLSIKSISLHVFSNNLLAGLLHREVGFRTTRIHRLIRKDTGNEISFSVDTQSSPAPGDVGYSRMEITAHELIKQHDWLKSIYG